jgi:hypothetical protein
MTINELIKALKQIILYNNITGETPVYHYDADGKYVLISAPKIIYLDKNKKQVLQEERGSEQMVVSVSRLKVSRVVSVSW